MNFETAVPVGKGATGEVAKAWDPKLNRWVALKFLAHDTPEAEERMLREARAQAKIEHPNVCRVYDVGERDGRRYIAMQYIDGERLDVAARDLDIDAKVGLLRTIAEAVQAAHSAGLIHRDLKPANILVETTDDGQFHPYVVDFGIAREQEVAGETMTGQVIGTPGYLSPEQARGEASTLDRRSDVFSLGVILYELLSGIRPHAGDSEADVLVNLLREEPTSLSLYAPNISADVETIVMTCLEKDREKRYPSARALADDLGRFLNGEPIEARPTTRIEKLRRKARKNPVAASIAGVAAIAVIILAVALIASWVQYTKNLKQEREAALAAQRQAEEKEAEAQEVADFLVSLFEVSNPAIARGSDITARELLRRGAENVKKELVDQPLIQARMMAVIADVYGKLGIWDEAADLALGSLELRRSTLGKDDLLVAESFNTVATIHNSAKRWEYAVKHLRKAAQIQESKLGPESVELARTRAGLATALLGLRQLEDADDNNSAALRVLLSKLGPDDQSVLNARVTAATILRARRDYEGAAVIYEDVLERARRTLGPDHPFIPVTLNNLAFMRRALKDYDRAAALYREALTLHEAINPEPHAERIGILQNLAGTLHLDGRLEEAEEALRQAADLSRQVFPEGHWRIGSALVNGLGRILLEKRKYADAEATIREGVEIWEKGLGPGNSWTATGKGMLASSLAGQGRHSEAGVVASSSIAILDALPEFNAHNWTQVEKIIASLEQSNSSDLATRYRALLTEERRPEGLAQAPTSTR